MNVHRRGTRPRNGAAAVTAIVTAFLALLVAHEASAEPIEPPPEAAEGADFTTGTSDSLEPASVEWTVGALGQNGSSPRRRRSVQFRSDSMSGVLNEGEQDPLAGGSVSGRSLLGEFGAGSLAPRWGRGLVLGAPADPWSAVPMDRGRAAPFRGRSGDGFWLRRDGDGALEAFTGRFARQSLAGIARQIGPLRAGVVGGRTAGRRRTQASFAAQGSAAEAEWALDASGAWRAEVLSSRALGASFVTLRVRAGLPGFRSLAEPRRSGPAQAATLALASQAGAWRGTLTLATWRFGLGATGARAGAELARRDPQGGRWVVGAEEQNGVRRPDVSGRGRGMRQGWWTEWNGGDDGIRLAVRHESWGEAAFARAAVRRVVSAGADVALPYSCRLRLAHAVYRTRRGESLYLPEREHDRLVLLALSGAGQRTRLEALLPLAGGTVRSGLVLTSSRTRAHRAQWSLDWTRRLRLRR